MRMVLNEPLPVEVTDLLARRRAHGQDTHDEVWNGEYHVSPAANNQHARLQSHLNVLLWQPAADAGLHLVAEINVGRGRENFRVPDLALLRHRADLLWNDDVAIVIEVLSPDGEAWEKFDHYAEFGVVEIFMVDSATESVRFFVRKVDDTAFTESAASVLLDITTDGLANNLDW